MTGQTDNKCKIDVEIMVQLKYLKLIFRELLKFL